MPRVPEYGLQFGQDVPNIPAFQSQNLPDYGGRDARAAAQIGQNLDAMNAGMLKVAATMKEQADNVRVNEALNDALQLQQYLTLDQKEGYVHRKGKDMLDPLPGTNESPLKSWQQKYREGLADIEERLYGEQKQKFRDRADRMYMQYDENLMKHTNAQFTTYKQSVAEGTITVNQNNMGLLYSKPEETKQARDAIEQAVYDTGRMQGWSAPQIAAVTLAQLSKGHSLAIETAVNGNNVVTAKEYLAQHENELTAADRIKAKKLVESGDLRVQAQQSADAIIAAYPDDEAAALEANRTRNTGEVRDNVEVRLNKHYSDKKRIQRETDENNANKVYDILSSTGSLSRVEPSLFKALPWNLQNTFTAIERQLAKGEEIQTDMQAYYFIKRFSADDPDNFINNFNPLEYAHKISKGDMKQLIDLQAHMRKEGKDSVENVYRANVIRQISSTAKKMDLKGDKEGAFMYQAEKAIKTEELRKSRNLDYGEVDGVIAGLVMRENEGGGWFLGLGKGQYGYAAKNDGTPFIPTYTPQQIQKMRETLDREKAPIKHNDKDAIAELDKFHAIYGRKAQPMPGASYDFDTRDWGSQYENAMRGAPPASQ